MRRLPVYFLIDLSESMVGQPIEEVQNGMRTIITELNSDPYALETVFVSIIGFAGKAKTIAPLTELYKFYPPQLHIGGGTSLGKGLEALMDSMDRDLVKTTREVKGDWKPIIFLFTDGTPTDDYTRAFKRWNEKYRRHCNLVAVSIGDNINTQILGQITDNVLLLKKTDAKSFKEFFKWVTASIKTTSASVSEENSDELKLPTPSSINLEKVDPNASVRVDENFVVVVGKCSSNKRLYLIKFARKLGNIEDMENLMGHGYRLVGAYTINEEEYNSLSDSKQTQKNINTSELFGAPTCPCCGNQIAFVVCGNCGKISCTGTSHMKCGWCGAEGELEGIGEGGMDVGRTLG